MFTTPLQQLLALSENERIAQRQNEGESLCQAPDWDHSHPAGAADGITMLPMGARGWPVKASPQAGDDRQVLKPSLHHPWTPVAFIGKLVDLCRQRLSKRPQGASTV